MHGLQQAGVLVNRKMLSQIAIEDPRTFDELVEMAAGRKKKQAQPAAAAREPAGTAA